MKYMIGCNFWGSKYGIDMWKYWDEASIREDLKHLASCGVKYMRVFPNWRDFQPVEVLHTAKGAPREYRFPNDKVIDNEFFIDMEMISRFETFCDIAKENGIKFIVAIVTGWMSGRLYYPPCLTNKNLITDPQALSLESKFVRGFVRHLKHRKEIAYWDLGNECNNLGSVENPWQAYLWTSTIRNAILAEDQSRQIMSGMHGLQVSDSQPWTIKQQAELNDILTPHPYASSNTGGHISPMNRMRTALLPTAQVEIYSGVGGKPALMQEIGHFSNMLSNDEMSADWMRVNLFSGWANGSIGLLWWCGHDQLHLKNPPNSWSMTENELGLLREDYSQKPVAKEMKKFSETISNLPFGELPKRTAADAVYIVPNMGSGYAYTAEAAYILAKQAGFDLTFCYGEDKLPDSDLYIIPPHLFWSGITINLIDELIERVSNGATILVTSNEGFYARSEELFGLRSNGVIRSTGTTTADFGGYTLPFSYGMKYLMEPLTAEVLARDTDGTVIFSVNKLGKGKVYFLNFPLEDYAFGGPETITNYPYYKIYETVAKDIILNKNARSLNPKIGVTVHPFDDKHFITVAINYMHTEEDLQMVFPENAEVRILYGNADSVPSCDAAIFDVYLR